MNEENNYENIVNQTNNTTSDTLNTFNTEYNSGNNGKKTNKNVIMLLATIILGLLIVVGSIYYFKVFSSAHQFYKKAVGSVIDDCSEQLLKDEFKTIDVKLSLDADIKLEESLPVPQFEEILDLINKSSIDFGLKYDNENGKAIIDLEADYDKEELLDVQLYSDLKNEELYIHLGNLLDKYYELDADDFDISFEKEELTKEEKASAKKFMKELKKEILKSIKKEYCSNSKEKIEIDGKTVTATKNTFKIEYNQFINEVKQLLNRVKNNERMLECLKEEVQEDFPAFIDNILENIEETDDTENMFMEYSIYTKGILANDIVKFEAKISSNNEEMVLLIVEKKTENEWLYNIHLDGTAKIYGTLYFNDKEADKINLNVEVEELGKVSLDLGYDIKIDEKIETIDVSNVTHIDDMTEQDATTLMNNLQKSKLYELISIFANNTGSETSAQIQNLDQIITVNVPQGYIINNDYSSDYTKYLEKGNVQITISSSYSSVDDYYDGLKATRDSYLKNDFYKNVTLDLETEEVNGKKFYCALFEYEYGSYGSKNSNVFIWTQTSEKYIAVIQLVGIEDITSEELNTLLSSLRVQSK